MGAELGHAMRRKRPRLTRADHAKRAEAYARAALRYESKIRSLLRERRRLEDYMELCWKRSTAHQWAAKVSPKKGNL